MRHSTSQTRRPKAVIWSAIRSRELLGSRNSALVAQGAPCGSLRTRRGAPIPRVRWLSSKAPACSEHTLELSFAAARQSPIRRRLRHGAIARSQQALVCNLTPCNSRQTVRALAHRLPCEVYPTHSPASASQTSQTLHPHGCLGGTQPGNSAALDSASANIRPVSSARIHPSLTAWSAPAVTAAT